MITKHPRIDNILLWDFKEESITIERFNLLAKPSLFDSFWISYCKDPKDTLLVPVFGSEEETKNDFLGPKEKMMDFKDMSSRLSMSFIHEENRALFYDSKERWMNMACKIFSLRIEDNKLYGDVQFLQTSMGKWLENNFNEAEFHVEPLNRNGRSCFALAFLKKS